MRVSTELHYLYDNLVESLLRIHQFAQVKFSEVSGETREDWEHVAHLIARRDILILAASVRNFSESTNTTDNLKTRSIQIHQPIKPFAFPFTNKLKGNVSSISIHQAYSRIIHAIEMDLLSGARLIAALTDCTDPYGMYKNIERFKQTAVSAHTLISLKTEKCETSLFSLNDLIDQTIHFVDHCHSVIPAELHFYSRSIRDL